MTTFFSRFVLVLLCWMGMATLYLATAQTSISGSTISIVGEDFDEASNGDIDVSIPSSVQSGDVTFLFLGQSDETDLSAPSGWTRIVLKGPADINQEALYRVYQSGQSRNLSFRTSRNAFAYLITLRGVDNGSPFVAYHDAKDTDRGGESTCSSGHRGRAKDNGRINTASNGIRILSCMFDDPVIGEVFSSSQYRSQDRVMDIRYAGRTGSGMDAGDGMMVAIESTNGSQTSDRYVQGVSCVRGGGNDIVISIAVRPSGGGGGGGGGGSTCGTVLIDPCESTSGWSNSSANSLTLSGTRQVGSHSIKSIGQGTDDFRKNFSAVDGSGTNVLEFWYYVSSVSRLDGNNQVELGSGGRADQNEYNWDISRSTLSSNSWHKVRLPFSSANTTNGAPDLTRLNWFRLYRFKNGSVTSRIDDIKLVCDPSRSNGMQVIPEPGSAEVTALDNFAVFPNPAQGYFKILLNDAEFNPVTIRVSNLQGQTVLESTSNEAVKAFDVSHLAPGVYMVTVANEKATQTTRLVVQ